LIDITNLVQDGPNWGRTGLGWAWDRASAEGLGCDINITCELKKTWSLSHTYTASNLRNWVFHSRPETYCDPRETCPCNNNNNFCLWIFDVFFLVWHSAARKRPSARAKEFLKMISNQTNLDVFGILCSNTGWSLVTHGM